jgi:hypothetical protein
MPRKFHTIRISDELWELLGHSGSYAQDILWAHFHAKAAGRALAAEPKPEPPKVVGTPIVAELRTRCPECLRPVEPGDDAVMMDWPVGGGKWRSKALHPGCAEKNGCEWRRPAA